MQRIWNRVFRDVFGYACKGPLETKDLLEKKKIQKNKHQKLKISFSCKLCRQRAEYRRQRQEDREEIQKTMNITRRTENGFASAISVLNPQEEIVTKTGLGR